MRRRIMLFAALLVIVFGTAGLAAVNTVASAAPAVDAPAVEVATNQGSSSQCMNRDGGGTSTGTAVIGWSCGDNNNDFEIQSVWYQPCQSQTVTSTCPFTDTAMDAYFDGAPIVEVEEYDYSHCVGTAGSTLFSARLEGCANQDGLDGGWNGIMVAPGQANGSNNPDCLISVHSTNAYGGTTNVYGYTSNGHGQGLTVATGNAKICGPGAQWKELFN